MSSTIIAQVNLNHSPAGHNQLADYIRNRAKKAPALIVGIQEPYINKHGMVATLVNRNTIYHRNVAKGRPRAAIYHTNAVHLVPHHTYMTPDLATALWTVKGPAGSPGPTRYIMVASVYMDIT